jgi:hypothetical protein
MIAILLSSHDDVCCRSNSVRNLLLLLKVSRLVSKTQIHIFVHPGEFLFIYKIFCVNLFKECELSFYNRANNLNVYNAVYSVFSSILVNYHIKNLFLYDPALKNQYMLNIIKNAKILE